MADNNFAIGVSADREGITLHLLIDGKPAKTPCMSPAIARGLAGLIVDAADEQETRGPAVTH